MPTATNAPAQPIDHEPHRRRLSFCKALAAPADMPADAPSPIEPTGGDFGAGLIRGVSACTHGEALGWGFWGDLEFISSLVAAGKAADEAGRPLKCRYTHPGLCADGLGKHLARGKNWRLSPDGSQALCDLHFLKTAHRSPDGDLAAYCLDLAAEDPLAFACSIVFWEDEAAQEAHYVANLQLVTDPATGETRPAFISPDPANVDNLPHVRLKSLEAVDLVDEPAANPGGLFSSGTGRADLAAAAYDLVDYAAGLVAARPDDVAPLGIDPDQAKTLLAAWLNSRQLSLTPTSQAKPEASQPPAPPADQNADLRADLAKFAAQFGAQPAADLIIGQGLSYAAAVERHATDLADRLDAQAEAHATALAQIRDEAQAKLTSAHEKLAAAEKRLAAAQLGQAEPVSQTDPTATNQHRPDKLAHLSPGIRQFVDRYQQPQQAK